MLNSPGRTSAGLSAAAIVPWLFATVLAMVLAAGCASTKVSHREQLVTEKLPRPGHIWVHDFAATPADVPNDSALAGQHAEHVTPPDPRADRRRP